MGFYGQVQHAWFFIATCILHSELGFSNTRIGAVEGFALVVSNFSRVFSGVLSDMLKSRVKVIAVGSVMTAMMKLVLASALSVQWVVMAKLLDRFGKGIRAAPTDASVLIHLRVQNVKVLMVYTKV